MACDRVKRRIPHVAAEDVDLQMRIPWENRCKTFDSPRIELKFRTTGPCYSRYQLHKFQRSNSYQAAATRVCADARPDRAKMSRSHIKARCCSAVKVGALKFEQLIAGITGPNSPKFQLNPWGIVRFSTIYPAAACGIRPFTRSLAIGVLQVRFV